MTNQVAMTILKQLGGNKFIVMTGANNLTAHENTLVFKLPRANNAIKYVKITLEGNDTYTMRFLKRDVKSEVAVHSDVYFDMLQSIFSKETGLATRLF